MTIQALITRYAANGVALTLTETGQLKLAAAKGVLDEASRQELAAHRDAIIAWLREVSFRGATAGPDALQAVAHTGQVALSHAQMRLWFAEQRDPGSAAYTIPMAYRMQGPIDAAALHAAAQAVVARHATLRTQFRRVDGQVCQVIGDVPVVDWKLVETADDAATRTVLAQEVHRGFDLECDPLLRMRLYREATGSHVLYVSMHHIVSDGWSIAILVRELLTHYLAMVATGRPAPLPPLPVDYRDYTVWQVRHLTAERCEREIAYWRRQLDGWSPLELELDHPRSARPTGRGGRHSLAIDETMAAAAASAAHHAGTTVFVVLLAAFGVLLRQVSGQDDIVIGTDVANRNERQLEELIGFFVNQLVIRLDLQRRPAFSELIARVHRTTLEAYSHQDLPFDRLVGTLLEGREYSLHPFFQTKFILQNTPGSNHHLDATLEPITLPDLPAKFDMTWAVTPAGSGYTIDIDFNEALFDRETVVRLADRYTDILRQALSDPDRGIDRYVSDPAGRADWIARANQAQHVDRPLQSLGRLLHETAERFPDADAVIDLQTGQRLSYRELDAAANRLARQLIEWGIEPESRIGVCIAASADYLETAVAVSKAGAVLLPIDPTYPNARIAEIARDADLSLLIGDSDVLDRFSPLELGAANPIPLQDYRTLWEHQDSSPPSVALNRGQLAYMVFTSGTTGRPKGVMVSVDGIAALAAEQTRRYGTMPGKRVLAFASVGFDASQWELLMAVASGATLVCAGRERVMPGRELGELIAAHGITHITLPPSALGVLPIDCADRLDVLVLAGEACRDETVRRWAGRRVRIFNAYGPSESTVCSTMTELGLGQTGFNNVVGEAIAGIGVYIRDTDDQLAVAGFPGELCIAGTALARGYWNDPRQTAERFVPDPFADRPGARLYRSGDRARAGADGQITFLGRIDQQVKVRGHRVELGEIEAQLLRQPGVCAATVVLSPTASPGMVGYVVASPGTALDHDSLRQALRHVLPEYMVPRHVMVIDSIPLTSNGKIDAQALPAPAPRAASAGRAPTAMERNLLSLWQSQLGSDAIGLHDNFFDVGGDSLMLVAIQEQLSERFAVTADIAALFKHPTIASLAAALAQPAASVEDNPEDARIDRRREALSRRSAVRKAAGDLHG